MPLYLVDEAVEQEAGADESEGEEEREGNRLRAADSHHRRRLPGRPPPRGPWAHTSPVTRLAPPPKETCTTARQRGCPRRPAARADNVKDRVELAGGAGGRGGTRAYNSASRAAQAGGEETHARTHARARRGGGRGSWGGRRTMLRGGDLDLPPLLSSLLRLPLRFLVSDRLRQIRVWILEPISFKPGAFRL